MTCPHCRFENPEEARFCTECGAALQPVQKSVPLPCPQCKYENAPDSAFCLKCGSSLKGEPKKVVIAQSGPAPEKQQPPAGPKTKAPVKEAPKTLCAECGSENEADDAFCTNCGTSLKPKPPKEPAKTVIPQAVPKPIAPQAPAMPPPAPIKAAEPKAKPTASVPATLPPDIQPKPEPRPSPEPKLGAVSAPAKEPTATKTIAKTEAPAPPSLAKRQIIEKSLLPLEKAPQKVEPPVEKISAKPRKRGKGLLGAGLAAGLVIIILAVWFFALRPKPSGQPAIQASAPAETAPPAAPAPALEDTAPAMPSAATPTAPPEEKQKPSEPAPSPTVLPSPAQNKPVVAASRPAEAQARPQPAAVSGQVAKGVEAFQQKNYDQCIKEMQSVLALDPGNKTAQRYLADAQSKKNAAAEVGRFIKAAVDAYQAGDFNQCLEQTQKALALDPAQAEALRYEEMAHQKLAPQRVKALVDQFNAAANSGQLPSFYEASCSPALFQKIKRNAELMNVQYDQFRSQTSQTTIRFLDNGRLEARFSNITTGQLISEGRKMIIFEGATVWTLERQGDRWLIVDLQSQPIRKQKS